MRPLKADPVRVIPTLYSLTLEVAMMGAGVILCFAGALSFGIGACVAKMAERRNCKASPLVVSLCGWSAVFMLVRTLALGTGFQMPLKVIEVAVALGICGAVAFFAFQTSIGIGKVTVAWLMMNLSAGVPALVSIWLYNERLTLLKCAAYVIALAALLCLFQGNRIEWKGAKQLGGNKEASKRLAWSLLMVIILLTNGMSSFGLKVIATWALPGSNEFPYLTVWYAAGFACIGLPMLIKGIGVGLNELGWGAALAILSIGGQVAMAKALNSNVPGNIVFPVTIGGCILVVVLAGRFFFGERMNRMSAAGVTLGFGAVIILSVS